MSKTIELTGTWRFAIDQDDRGESMGWHKQGCDTSAWKEVRVPGAWNFYDDALFTYEGIGWYAADISLAGQALGEVLRLHLERVHAYAKVWLNGHSVGCTDNPYLPHTFLITPYYNRNGANTLIIKIDNTPHKTRLPGCDVVEWMQYGGILRPVSILAGGEVAISQLHIDATPQDKTAQIGVALAFTNASSRDVTATIRIHIARSPDCTGTEYTQEVFCKAGQTGKLAATLAIDDYQPWSPDNPALYQATAQLLSAGEVLDNYRQAFGIRSIAVNADQILLNGEPLVLKGVNRYNEYKGYGSAVPDTLTREDLLTIKSTGVNLIRSHYPLDSSVLDMLDEIGILCMEEIPLNWWATQWFGSLLDEQGNQSIVRQAEGFLEKMIQRDRNHPSVMIWSMSNECGTDSQLGIGAMNRLLRTAKTLDSSRLVTFVAAMSAQGSAAFENADIVCINYYSVCKFIEDIDEQVYQATHDHLIAQKALNPGKPLLVTEYGTPSIQGIAGDVRFSEDFQASYLRATWQGILHSGVAAGGVLWAWADYYHRRHFNITIEDVGFLFNATYGPFGVVTIDRKPKKSLETLRQMYT